MSLEKSEKILRKFMKMELNLSKEDANDISFEHVHRIGKSISSDHDPLIAKFTFHKDKELVLSYSHGKNSPRHKFCSCQRLS